MKKGITLIIVLLGLLEHLQAQKGERSLAAGLLVSFPQNMNGAFERRWKTGLGAEAIGQINFTNRSAGLLQLQLIRFGETLYYDSSLNKGNFWLFSWKVGYRYQLTPSGYYANILAGAERNEGFTYTPITLGAGKRFLMKNIHFLDAGLELTDGFVNRFNIRAVYSLRRRTADN